MSALPFFRKILAINTAPVRANKFVIRTICSTTMDKEVDFENLQQQLKDNAVVLIDVRSPEEIAKDGKIAKSINIPFGNVKEAFQLSNEEFEKIYKTKKPSPTDKVVMHCHIGKRAVMASDIAKELGLNAIPYKGSFSDWVAKGGPVTH